MPIYLNFCCWIHFFLRASGKAEVWSCEGVTEDTSSTFFDWYQCKQGLYLNHQVLQSRTLQENLNLDLSSSMQCMTCLLISMIENLMIDEKILVVRVVLLTLRLFTLWEWAIGRDGFPPLLCHYLTSQLNEDLMTKIVNKFIGWTCQQCTSVRSPVFCHQILL